MEGGGEGGACGGAQGHGLNARVPASRVYPAHDPQVQYPDVSRLYETDLWAMSTVAYVTSLLFEDVDLKWMVDEFRVNVRAVHSAVHPA